MNIVLAVTGSIAAYKTPELVRLFKKQGCEVRCILTSAGAKFVTPEVLQIVSGHPVTTDFWSLSPGEIGHIELADWADVILVAPASADALAKITVGIADEPLYATVLASKATIVVAPAMNVNMWDASVTQHNISSLKKRGVQCIEPEEGALACGWTGSGRLACNEVIVHRVLALKKREGCLKDKRVVVITGPTREYIDPVRYISNESSGLMGLAMAQYAYDQGADVSIISGPVGVQYPQHWQVTSVVSAREMLSAALAAIKSPPDIIVMCAAVADVRPAQASRSKVKKSVMPSALALEENPDIIATLSSKIRHSKTAIVGFNVETGTEEELVKESLRKCKKKKLDVVAGNLAKDSFGKDTNQVVLVAQNGQIRSVPKAPKLEIAQQIYDFLRSSRS